MEHVLKTISKEGIAEALSKADVYRYLNEPGEAESICRDVLAIDSGNQPAIRLLGLAITDQFTGAPSDRYAEAEAVFKQLESRYEQFYYAGLVRERRAKAQLRAGRSPHTLYVLFEEAMRFFEEAEKVRPDGNDDSILRWNRCVRLLKSLRSSEHHAEGDFFEVSDSPPV
jgi:hypothetical protein